MVTYPDMPLEAAPTPIYIVGLGLPPADSAAAWPMPPHSLLDLADVIIGGKAQLASVGEHPAERLVVGADIPGLLQRIAENRRAGKRQVALCSGDPLFFGLGARLREYFGPEGLHVLPAVSSLQGAAALLRLPWEHIRCVSLHGRSSFTPLTHALMTGEAVFILSHHPVAEIARFLTERGRTAYRLHALENLRMTDSGVHAEKIVSLSLEEALTQPDMTTPGTARVVALEPLHPFPQPSLSLAARPARVFPESGRFSDVEPGAFGIPDALLERENNLFTKWPARAVALAALRIGPHHIVWDLGAGSGAVALEASFLAHRGQVIAVEKNLRRVEDIAKNRARFGAATLEIVHGTMPERLTVADPEPASTKGVLNAPPSELPYHAGACILPRPHRIFIGGGLGGAAEDAFALLSRAWEALLPGGRLAAHCILLESLERVRAFLRDLNVKEEILCMQTSQTRPLGEDMYLEGANPVFLVIAHKPADAQGGTGL